MSRNLTFSALMSRLDELDSRERSMEQYFAPGKRRKGRAEKHRFADQLEPGDRVQSIRNELFAESRRRPVSAPVNNSDFDLSTNRQRPQTNLGTRKGHLNGKLQELDHDFRFGLTLKPGLERITKPVKDMETSAWQEVEDEFQQRLMELNAKQRKLLSRVKSDESDYVSTRPLSSQEWTRGFGGGGEGRRIPTAEEGRLSRLKSHQNFEDGGSQQHESSADDESVEANQAPLPPFGIHISGIDEDDENNFSKTKKNILSSQEARRRAREFEKKIEKKVLRQFDTEFEYSKNLKNNSEMLMRLHEDEDISSKKFYQIKIKVEVKTPAMQNWEYDVFVADVSTAAKKSVGIKKLRLTPEGFLIFKNSGSIIRDYLSPSDDLPWVSSPIDLFGHKLNIEIFKSPGAKLKTFRVGLHTIHFGAHGNEIDRTDTPAESPANFSPGTSHKIRKGLPVDFNNSFHDRLPIADVPKIFSNFSNHKIFSVAETHHATSPEKLSPAKKTNSPKYFEGQSPMKRNSPPPRYVGDSIETRPAGSPGGGKSSPAPNKNLQQSLAELRESIRGSLKQTQQSLQASLAARDSAK